MSATLTLLRKVPRAVFARRRHVTRRIPFLRKPLRHLQYPGEARRRRAAVTALPVEPAIGDVVQRLREDGFARLEGYFGLPSLHELDEAAGPTMRELAQTREVTSRKAFMSSFPRPSTLDAGHPFVRFALQPRLLHMAARYTEEFPCLATAQVLVSYPDPEGRLSKSQLFHRDWDDTRMVKLFVYLNDVEREEDGPLWLIPAPLSARIREPLVPIHKPDARIARHVPQEYWVPMYGARFDAFLVDTHRCYHMGSRITRGGRFVYQAVYTTFASFLKVPYKIDPTGARTPEERMALGPA